MCSRGTSKSFTIGSLFPPTKSLLYRNTDVLVASGSRFRGGKLVLRDSARLLRGNLKNQKTGRNWGIQSLLHKPTLIKKDPDMWYQDFTSNSQVMTIPTNNEESVRGIRAKIIAFDEYNTFDGEVIQKVFRPFLAVGSDFENAASGSESNQVFEVGTVDYSYKPWFKEIISAQDLAKIQYQIQMALKDGNWALYDVLMSQHGKRVKNLSLSITRFDYTDLLIPTEIGNFKVKYPGAKTGKQIIYDERDQVNYIYTYPVAKKILEEPLDEGLVDRETWEAEQRNMFIRADGNVYPYDLIEKVSGPIYSETEEKKRNWNSEREGVRYLPPVLLTCSDPCVLGVDTARTSDYSAFTVIRMGQFFPNQTQEYDLATHSGASPWSNVIWCEQHQQMTTKDVGDKIRELRSRYNIVATRQTPGIVMDSRGGGANVRDELVNPTPPVDPDTGLAISGWAPPQRIFDPEDKDDRLGKNLLADPSAWFGLRLLDTTDVINHDLVVFSKAQFQTNKLFIGSSKSRKLVRDPTNPIYLGLVGLDILKHQLLRIQGKLTESQKNVRYEMPGDTKKVENKKDMMFSFLYACYALKEWITHNMTSLKDVPVAYGEVFSFPSRWR